MRKAFLWVVGLSVALGVGGFTLSQPPPPEELLYPLTVCPEGPPQCDFPTIGEAVAAAAPEALILIYPGTYRENLTLTQSVRLVATESGQVRIQGTQTSEEITGGVVITLQVEGEMDVLLEGITVLGRTDPGGAPVPANRSTGIAISGQGDLTLKLIGVQVANSSFGIFCYPRPASVSVEILLEKSRLAANAGSALNCEVGEEKTAVVQIKDSIISGNWIGVGVHDNTQLLLEETVFARNVNAVGVGDLDSGARNTEVRVWRSRFLNNVANGIGMSGGEGNRLEVRESLFWGDGAGIYVLNKTTLEAYDNEFRGLQYGLRMMLGTQVYLEGNTFESNQDGMIIVPFHDPRREEHSLLEAYRNRFVGNECGIKIHDVQAALHALEIEAEGNEFSGNEQNLCPELYPWPEDFTRGPH